MIPWRRRLRTKKCSFVALLFISWAYQLLVILPMQILRVQRKQQHLAFVCEFLFLVIQKQFLYWIGLVNEHPRIALTDIAKICVVFWLEFILHFLFFFEVISWLFVNSDVHIVVSDVSGIPHVVRGLSWVEVEEYYFWPLPGKCFLLIQFAFFRISFIKLIEVT